jgi:hypothetical protein
MSRYFSNFPLIQYGGETVRDISRRSKVVDEVFSDPYVFLPYTIREGEKPEDVAYYYYGTVDDTWLVLLANNITDPYAQWPLDDEEFNQYFINKYAELSGKTGEDVIRWGQNQTIDENIIYYYKEIDKSTGTIPFNYTSSSRSFLDVTPNEIEQLLDDQVVVIDGIPYRLVKEE